LSSETPPVATERSSAPSEEADRLQAELAKAQQLAQDRLSQLRYLQADLENLRKSFARERAEVERRAVESFARDLLPVLDDFDRALATLPDGDERRGLSLLHGNLLSVLQARGLRALDPVGKPFDPFLHEAVARESSDKPEGTVLSEIVKGYAVGDRVIRPSQVRIAASPPTATPEGDSHDA